MSAVRARRRARDDRLIELTAKLLDLTHGVSVKGGKDRREVFVVMPPMKHAPAKACA